MSNLKKQIENAQKHIRKMKKAAPYLYPQYVNMVHRKQELDEAQRRYDEAKKIWDEFGETSNS